MREIKWLAGKSAMSDGLFPAAGSYIVEHRSRMLKAFSTSGE